MQSTNSARFNVWFFPFIIFSISLVGCASVSVNKLDKSGNVVPGTAEGLRFYLPRPYVSVFEPFIIASDVYLAKGELSPDGNYVLLTQVPPGLDAIVNQGLRSNAVQTMGSLAVEAASVVARPAASFGPQGAAVGEAPPAGAPAVTTPAAGAPAAEAPSPGTAGTETPASNASSTSGGLLNYKATSDNTAFAVIPQPRYFNILWLPDFDEQYVVSAKAGLGNAGVVINLGQGWSLQGLDAKVDNSALAKPLLDFYSKTLAALQKLATAKIEGPLAALAGPQAAPVPSAKVEFKGGTPLTVKVTRVRIVAPGLYPILKPGELGALTLSAEEQKHMLLPKPPLTNIAFNTYEAIVIEAARATGDAALRIHQYVDSTASGSSVTSGHTTPSPGDDLKGPKTKLDAELSKPENKTKTGEYYQATLSREGGVIKVQLNRKTGGTAGTRDSLSDAEAMKKLVTDVLSKLGITVSEANISIASK